MRHLLILVLFALSAAPSMADTETLIGDAPLPHSIAIDGDSTSPFVGIWTGKWDSWRSHILVVEGQDEDGTYEVIYSVGPGNQGVRNWFRSRARADGETLTFTDPDFPPRYTLSGTGRLRGLYPIGGGFAVLERRELSEVLAAPTDDWFDLGERDYLATDLVEDGEPIRLAVAVYAPPGSGPHPLALVHHGSTGRGTDPDAFNWFFTNDWFADVLNAHGWIAAFPQRRGRGGSDGLYDEGFAEDRAQGYSLEARLSLPGADRALTDANAALTALRKRDDVSDAPVLFSGISRGGVVAIMQAGHQPADTAGVINFVGGWMTGYAGDPDINPTVFGRIAGFEGTVLSIYGRDDPFYNIEHSLSNLQELERAGAKSDALIVTVAGHNRGHWALWQPSLWEDRVSQYLTAIGPAAKAD